MRLTSASAVTASPARGDRPPHSHVASGVRIGTGSIVGAGALIPEGKTIPPNSLVFGNPAKVVRRTDEKHAAMVQHGVEFYQGNSSRLRRELARQRQVSIDRRDDAAFQSALSADNFSAALQIIKSRAPRDYLLYGGAIEDNLRRHFNKQ